MGLRPKISIGARRNLQSLLDDGGDATISFGALASRPARHCSATNEEEEIFAVTLNASSRAPGYLPKPLKRSRRQRGTTPASPPYELSSRQAPFPAITSTTRHKSKFDNLYGCKERLVDAIRRAPDVMPRRQAPASPLRDVARLSLAANAAPACWSEVDPSSRFSSDGGSKSCPWRSGYSSDIFVTATATGRHHRHHIWHENMRSSATSALRQRDPYRALANISVRDHASVDEVQFPSGKTIIV